MEQMLENLIKKFNSIQIKPQKTDEELAEARKLENEIERLEEMLAKDRFTLNNYGIPEYSSDCKEKTITIRIQTELQMAYIKGILDCLMLQYLGGITNISESPNKLKITCSTDPSFNDIEYYIYNLITEK